MNEVVIMKMSNGEEIIANKTNSTDNIVFVDKPRVVFHNGEQGGLMPYVISNPDVKSFPINKSQIVGIVPAPKDLANSYLQATTGLILG